MDPQGKPSVREIGKYPEKTTQALRDSDDGTAMSAISTNQSREPT
jgi:hypothetical protein